MHTHTHTHTHCAHRAGRPGQALRGVLQGGRALCQVGSLLPWGAVLLRVKCCVWRRRRTGGGAGSQGKRCWGVRRSQLGGRVGEQTAPDLHTHPLYAQQPACIPTQPHPHHNPIPIARCSSPCAPFLLCTTPAARQAHCAARCAFHCVLLRRWRSVVSIPNGPSTVAVRDCAYGLARYAAIAQVRGLCSKVVALPPPQHTRQSRAQAVALAHSIG